MKSERCRSTSTLRREAEAEPSKKDVAEPDQIASGAAGTGQENEELEWMERHEGEASVPEEQAAGRQDNTPAAQSVGSGAPAPRLVERKTALRGQAIDHVQRPKRSVRSRTGWNRLADEPEVPYAAAEKAQRDLVCSLIERQDRVTEKLLLMINDLQYRTDDLELTVEAVLKRKTGIPSSPDRAKAGGPANSSTGRELT